VIYVGLIHVDLVYQFNKVPTGFIPEQIKGYLINVLQLPPGLQRLERTDAAAREASARLRDVPGVAHAVLFVLDGTDIYQCTPNQRSFLPH